MSSNLVGQSHLRMAGALTLSRGNRPDDYPVKLVVLRVLPRTRLALEGRAGMFKVVFKSALHRI